MNVVPAIKGNGEWTPNPQEFRDRQKKKNWFSNFVSLHVSTLLALELLSGFLFVWAGPKRWALRWRKTGVSVYFVLFYYCYMGMGGILSLLSSTVVLGSPGVFFYSV